MIDKETEEFFEKTLKDEKEIEQTYLDVFSEWDRGIFAIKLPSFITKHKNKKETKQQHSR